MKKVNFFSGQQVQKEDLAYLQDSVTDEIKIRTAHQYSKGVISPVAAYIGVDIGETLRVYPFQAYTNSGDRIDVPTDMRKLALDLTDDSNRVLGTQGFLADEDFGWRSDVPYLIVAQYTETAARPRPHYRTREPYATRIYSGFKFLALREGIDPFEDSYISLARVIYTDNRLIVTTSGVTEYAAMDATRMAVTVGTNVNNQYDINGSVSVDQHIRSIGDLTRVSSQNPHGLTAEILGLDANAVPEHERVFHAPGFIGDPNNVNSCFYTTVDARSIGVDFLSIKNLSTGDNLHYNGNTIKSYIYNASTIYIALSDDSGVWPDGTYTLFVNMRTKEIGVAADSSTVVDNRTYNILYNDEVQYTLHPINQSSVDPEYQYVLYSFVFKHDKEYTEIDLQGIGLNISNFIRQTDYRVFGSISGSNLQKNADGDFVANFPIKTTAIKFPDNTVLTSANAYTPGYIDKSLRLFFNSDSIVTVGTGVCKDSTNTITMNLTTEMNKRVFVPWVRGTNQGGLAPGLPAGEGTLHVFLIGTPSGEYDVAFDTAFDASHCVNPDPTQSSPIPGYKYYRRVGSLYIVRTTDTNTLIVRQFVTLPDSGNGVTTIFIQNTQDDKPYMSWDESGHTNLAIPSTFIGGSAPKYEYMRVKLNITNANSAYFNDYLYSGTTTMWGNIPHYMSVGDVEITTYNGYAHFSNNGWSGKVISYYDPRMS